MARVTTALVVIAFSVVFPSMVLATEYVVGDDLGWDGTANYQAWADDHAFHVGDVLSVYDSGNDALTLSVAGTYYFLCGYHCDTLQQTFFIVVG
ncbi:putative cupredoxin [Rosa chinensis]|uniref:Putative cupredoxin n=1 Tax=Rosa chinensis TaxID=74649 RepID=A0A2P6SG98_ROSCH|nr:putative cupredoxin [Rosa chinensis]